MGGKSVTKRGLGFENGATLKEIQAVRAELEPGGSGLQVDPAPQRPTTPRRLVENNKLFLTASEVS